jgi:hypothetical protein
MVTNKVTYRKNSWLISITISNCIGKGMLALFISSIDNTLFLKALNYSRGIGAYFLFGVLPLVMFYCLIYTLKLTKYLIVKVGKPSVILIIVVNLCI